MGRPSLSDEQVANTRKLIRGAAFELFRSGGFDAISIRQVASMVGLAPSAIYKYFTNRQDLIRAIWFEPVAEAIGEMAAIASRTRDPALRLERILLHYLKFASDQPDVYREALLYVRPRSQKAPPRTPIRELPFYRLLRDAIEEGQTKGVFRKSDPNVLAQILWAGVHGVVALPINIEGWDYAPQAKLNITMVKSLVAGLKQR